MNLRLRTAPSADYALFLKNVELPNPPKAGIALVAPIPVRANHGRWIVDCPICSSAQLATPDDQRFFCVTCGNINTGGQWRPVTWPSDPKAIESMLIKRPRIENMNWQPDETIAVLQSENSDHGLD